MKASVGRKREGFGVWGLGFRVQGLRVWGLGFRVSGLGFRVEGLGFRSFRKFRSCGIGVGTFGAAVLIYSIRSSVTYSVIFPRPSSNC